MNKKEHVLNVIPYHDEYLVTVIVEEENPFTKKDSLQIKIIKDGSKEILFEGEIDPSLKDKKYKAVLQNQDSDVFLEVFNTKKNTLVQVPLSIKTEKK